PSLVAARLHEPIDDHQPVADLAEARGFINKRLFLDAGHPPLGIRLGNDGFELVGLDFDGAVVFGGTDPGGVFRWLSCNWSSSGQREEQGQGRLSDKRFGKFHGMSSNTPLSAKPIRRRRSNASAVNVATPIKGSKLFSSP